MKKDKFNAKFRDFARTLSPKASEQELINKIYQSLNDLLGVNNCIQIGSYPRFTSITPIHDLDILYILGNWDENNHTPSTALRSLYDKIGDEYENPTDYKIESSLQTHSVTILFSQNNKEVLSIDIVPAYIYAKNDFGQDMYEIPEIIRKNIHEQRIEFYKSLAESHKEMGWIKSDPRGYIKVATETGGNSDFRKVVKIVKKWKSNLCSIDQNLKLKSFHLEQVITQYFQANKTLEIFDAIFKFFFELPNILEKPNTIRDRANFDKFIDDYLSKFTPDQKQKLKQARDGFLIKLENLTESDYIRDLLDINFYNRLFSEEFMFDNGIPVVLDEQHADFSISADITDKHGCPQRKLNDEGIVDSGRYLKFNKSKNIDGCTYQWKVKNDNRSNEPRGEITFGQTKNVPEHTKYRGSHYVECYVVNENKCIAKARQNVFILN